MNEVSASVDSGQALLAYLFGAVILAATINLVSGLASSSGGG